MPVSPGPQTGTRGGFQRRHDSRGPAESLPAGGGKYEQHPACEARDAVGTLCRVRRDGTHFDDGCGSDATADHRSRRRTRVYIFTGLVLRTAATHSVTATDVATSSITGTRSGVVVTPEQPQASSSLRIWKSLRRCDRHTVTAGRYVRQRRHIVRGDRFISPLRDLRATLAQINKVRHD